MSIINILTKADSEEQSIESNVLEGFGIQIRAPEIQETRSLMTEKSNNHVSQNQGLPTPRNLRSLSPKFDGDPALFWPEAHETTAFDIIAKSNRLADYKSSYRLVQSKIRRSLNSIDQKDGHVYLYEVEGNKGLVKIGYTGRSTEMRHKEWSFDCNREPKILYPIHSSSVMVPNASRIEALCHAELKHRRIRIYCKACLKQHTEWFEISPAEAIAVIQKWSIWIATRPYLESTVEWTLKEEEMQKAGDIDQFMEDILIADISTVA